MITVVACGMGCNAIQNGWLDVTAVGSFDDERTMEVRSSLSLEDTPFGIPGSVAPRPDDLEIRPCEYPISAGDTLLIEIDELRQRLVPYQVQSQVAALGYVNLPIIGRVQAEGLTPLQFEERLAAQLQESEVLVDPQVTVNPLFLQDATYSIFGVGVSAANNAPLRAGVFPIRRPDLRVLEAINQVGGLNEFVTDIYVFREQDDCPGLSELDAGADAGRTPAVRQAALRSAPPATSIRATSYGSSSGSQPTEDPPTHRQDLVDVILEDEEPPPARGQMMDQPDPATRELRESIEAEPTQPYIWDDSQGEFIPNPAYAGPTETPQPAPPTMETMAPMINWSRIAGDLTSRVIHVSPDALRSGDPAANIVIRAGDVIRIVSGEIGVYYVMGQVNAVGPFQFNAETITLKAAIAAAGGLSPLAWPDRCTVYRRIGQREQMIQVNLDRIFAGIEPDFVVKRGDIINVGTHPAAPWIRILRAASLPNVQSVVGYSFTYSRNFADIDSFVPQRNPNNDPDLIDRLFP